MSWPVCLCNVYAEPKHADLDCAIRNMLNSIMVTCMTRAYRKSCIGLDAAAAAAAAHTYTVYGSSVCQLASQVP